MKQKRTYIKPSSRVIVINSRPQLLVGSAAHSRFVDTADFEWDEEGAN